MNIFARCYLHSLLPTANLPDESRRTQFQRYTFVRSRYSPVTSIFDNQNKRSARLTADPSTAGITSTNQ